MWQIERLTAYFRLETFPEQTSSFRGKVIAELQQFVSFNIRGAYTNGSNTSCGNALLNRNLLITGDVVVSRMAVDTLQALQLWPAVRRSSRPPLGATVSGTGHALLHTCMS